MSTTIFFRLLLSQALIFCCLHTFGQNFPVYNSYTTNHYLYNPAEAASDFTYIFINHRQQWLGINGSPVISTVNFNTLLDQTRLGIGAKISSYKRGLLTTSDVQGTFAYGIPLTKNNAIYFGLSGGVISNSLDQNKIADPTDPAIANYLNNNLYPVGSAGVVYKLNSGLNLGVSMPQFIAQKAIMNEASSSVSFSPFNHIIVSAYYRKKVEGKLVSRTVKGMKTRAKTQGGYAPLEFYFNYKYTAIQPSQFELLAKLNLSQSFWVAAGYRQQYGVIASTGLAIKSFLLSYSYEPGGAPEKGFSTGTHEIQLGLRIGDEKRLLRKAPVLQSMLRTTTTTKEHHDTRLKHSVSDPEKEEERELKEHDEKRKFLVVIHSTTDFGQAEEFKKKLIAQKFNAEIYYYKKDKHFYVHVLQSMKQHEAHEEVRNLKNYTKLKEARVVTINED
jgi:type IX secretion system PorP/SprF family membrane protein